MYRNNGICITDTNMMVSKKALETQRKSQSTQRESQSTLCKSQSQNPSTVIVFTIEFVW